MNAFTHFKLMHCVFVNSAENPGKNIKYYVKQNSSNGFVTDYVQTILANKYPSSLHFQLN